MKLQNEKFTIDIAVINTTNCNFNDDYVVYFQENAEDEFSKTRILVIDNDETIHKIALVGDMFLYEEHCAVLEDTVLTVLQNNMLVQIDLSTCRVTNQKPIEEFGGNFELHLTPVGYLVYGESVIATYDSDLNQIWNFSGKDIFATISDKTAFTIENDSIKLYDFEDNFYELDFNGKLITEIRAAD